MEVRRELLESLVDSGDCYFDHHGNCQGHSFDLEPGELCPQAELKALLAPAEPLPPWILCTCGHSPHKHGTGEVPPALGSHCYAGEDRRDVFRTCSCEGYTPDGDV